MTVGPSVTSGPAGGAAAAGSATGRASMEAGGSTRRWQQLADTSHQSSLVGGLPVMRGRPQSADAAAGRDSAPKASSPRGHAVLGGGGAEDAPTVPLPPLPRDPNEAMRMEAGDEAGGQGERTAQRRWCRLLQASAYALVVVVQTLRMPSWL